jgi:predicted RNA-binding protein YlxR (DUF448 family)
VKAKRDLIRIVKSPGEEIIKVDPFGKGKGRGAYICPNVDCINRALQPDRLNRALKIASADYNTILSNMGKLRQTLLELIESHHR